MEEDAAVRLLIVSDSPAIASGLGRVTRELAQRFHEDGYDVAVAGWFDAQGPAMEFDYPVIGAVKHEPASLGPILQHVKPDVVLAMGDPWDFEWLAATRARTNAFRLIGYLTIDGEPLAMRCERILDGFDDLVTPTEYGRRIIDRRGVQVVPYGVDHSRFRPQERAPVKLFGRSLDQNFVVLVNAQNTIRKNLRAAILGFLDFAEGKTDTICYVNAKAVPGPNDAPGIDLTEVIVHAGAENTPTRPGIVWFNDQNNGPVATVGDEVLEQYYAMADVLLSTAMGEGFCLPVLEALASGVVPIAPDAYNMPELVGGIGVLMPVAARLGTMQGTTHVIVSEGAVARALGELYEEWKEGTLTHRVTRGVRFAQGFSWDATERQLSAIMQAGPLPRVALGGEITLYTRYQGRRAAKRSPEAVGILKLGGLGDMLQATTVVRAAAHEYQRQAVVFCNSHPEIFQAMPEVDEVVQIASQPQDRAVASLGDSFELFLDVRYVSRGYGLWQAPEEWERYRWFYDTWTGSGNRLETLRMHPTEVMLASLGLPTTDIRPAYKPRERVGLPDGRLIAVATGAGAMGGLKKWPDGHWADVVDRVLGRRALVVQVGGKEDTLVPGAEDCRGLSLPETAWILEHCELLIANENGLVHLMAAVGGKAVVIFGPTPQVFKYPEHEAVGQKRCQPCWLAEPMWSREQCAIGHRSCENFPSVDAVLYRLSNLGLAPARPEAALRG